ncbi:WSC domain-containing protein 1 [Geodia barretti]|uniref:WSC domain-containing protein 1 n=1 Tax=Geodia barretti TaxID=519541 RepID=A0AA35XGV0_GEOBA|nr:WSC domain-containing protein 1 [Geodia barretti]
MGTLERTSRPGECWWLRHTQLYPVGVGIKISTSYHQKPTYSAAVFILRNPVESAVAEWNRYSSMMFGKENSSIAKHVHTYTLPKESFDEEKWDTFLRGYMRHWSSRLLQWIIYQDKHPIHILRYEDLKQDTVGEIEKTLDFLDVSYDPETVRKQLNLDYADFKRTHHRNHYNYYSVEQKEFVNFFQTLNLWLEEPRLHDASLYLPGLPQQYNSQHLAAIFSPPEIPLTPLGASSRRDYTETEKGSIKAPQNCEQKNCLENLSESDKRALKSCENRTRKGYNGSISESDCKFLPNNRSRAVALASAPGAGNTWTRGLLEKASGICTGYLYCDTAMRAHGYVGENVKTGRVLVVKTHSIVPRWGGDKNFYFLSSEATYSAAVFILRNPVESAVAEWNRYSSMMFGKENSSIAKHVHTYTLPKESFDEEKWDMFLRGYMRHWSSRLLQWIIYQDKHPIHILRYEDLKQDTVGEIKKTLDFLDVSYDPETVRKKLNLDYTDFKRPHDRNHYNYYSVEQKEFVKSVLLDVNVAARRAKKAHLLRLDEYIPAF